MSSDDIDKFKEKITNFFKDLPKEIPSIPFDDLPPKGKHKDLPGGSFGQTYLTDDKTRVVKIIQLNRYVSDRMIQSLRNEIVNYYDISTLCPKYFCKFLAYSYDEDRFEAAIVMENCGTDLFEYFDEVIDKGYQDLIMAADNNTALVEKHGMKKMATLKSILYKVLEAIDCLHSNNYVHLDLKPENIVVNNMFEVKFIDAGSLTKIKPNTKTFVFGTPGYMGPELMRTHYHDCTDLLKKLDIYAFGKMCTSMLSRQELVCLFSGDTIVREMIEADPEKRPDVFKIMMYMNPGLHFSSRQREHKSNRKSKSFRTSFRRSFRSKSKSKSKSFPKKSKTKSKRTRQ